MQHGIQEVLLYVPSTTEALDFGVLMEYFRCKELLALRSLLYYNSSMDQLAGVEDMPTLAGILKTVYGHSLICNNRVMSVECSLCARF